jgi:hypothetical protein
MNASFGGGEGDGTRTRDPWIHSPLLYQLSYTLLMINKIISDTHTPRVRNSKKLEKPFDKEPLVGRGL